MASADCGIEAVPGLEICPGMELVVNMSETKLQCAVINFDMYVNFKIFIIKANLKMCLLG